MSKYFCEYCETEFESPRRYKSKDHNHIYCNKECAGKARSIAMKGNQKVVGRLEQARKSIKKSTLEERVWSNVEKQGESDCWNWTGSTTRYGYGEVRLTNADRPRSGAHRVVYEMLVGPIPEGLTIDHLCRNRLCVNPSHLEPVTLAENVRRASTKTHCPKGHPYTPENSGTSRNRKGRYCRTCDRERSNKRHQQKKQDQQRGGK